MRYLILFVLAFSAAGAAADGTERSAPYSALDTIRRAEVGTFSPRLREEKREPVRTDRPELFKPRFGVRCKFDESRPGTLICEERK